MQTATQPAETPEALKAARLAALDVAIKALADLHAAWNGCEQTYEALRAARAARGAVSRDEA